MKYLNRRIGILILLVFESVFSNATFSQSISPLRYTSYSTSDGLLNNTVTSIIQDEQDFIWIGTNGGLERFDGYSFSHYLNATGDSCSLSDNRVSTLHLDRKHQLWVGTTNHGLNLYNPIKDNFVRYIYLGENAILENQISEIEDDESGIYVIGTKGGGINLLNVVSGEFEDINFKGYPSDPRTFSFINTIVPLNGRKYIIGTHEGLCVFDLNKKQIFDYLAAPGDLKAFSGKAIMSMAMDSDSVLWIGTASSGLIFLDLQDHRNGKEFPLERVDIKFENVVNKVYVNHKDEVVIGSNRGVFYYFPDDQTYHFSRHTNSLRNSISSNRIISIFEDKTNILWLGSRGEGLNKADYHQKRFFTYGESAQSEKSLSSMFVFTFLHHTDNKMWIGTNLGLNLFDREDKTFRKIYFSEEHHYRNVILSLHQDTDDQIWVGTADGVIRFNTKDFTSKHISEILPNATQIHHSNARNILKDDQKNVLWIGSWIEGLYYINLDTKQYQHINLNRQVNGTNLNANVRSIKQDKHGDIWIATYGSGILKYLPKADSVIAFNQIQDPDHQIADKVLISIYIDSFGEIWGGTSTGGLVKYNKSTNNFNTISQRDGLAGNEIESIIDDHHGNIWVSTNQGISSIRFSPPRNDVFSEHLEDYEIDIKNYTVLDGLQSNLFYEFSNGKDDSNNLYFGGTHGFNVFNPDDIKENPYLATTVFTNLQIENKTIKTDEIVNGRVLLNSPIQQMQAIRLINEDHTLSLEFGALHYATPQKIKYKYILEGFDHHWIETDASRRFVTYSNLNPGNYSLKVKASNGDGLWNETPSVLKIYVSPPWWKTNWFYLSVILTLTGGIFSFLRYKTYNYKKRQQELEVIIKERTKEVNEQSKEIQAQNEELLSLNEEITAQSDQLYMQNDELSHTKDKLILAQNELKSFNTNLEQQVKQRTARLEKAIKELDHFVYSASHDLGAPLKSILGLINITKHDINDSKALPNLEMMESSINSLEKVIKSLKQYSRNSSLEVEYVEFDLNKLIQNLIHELKFIDSYYRISIELKVPQPTLIISDFQRIRSVLINLIDNALKYYDPRKEKSFISINYIEEKTHWKLKIEDNGVGVEPEQLDKIFNMFHRATENSNGSGLGLYIVRESLSKLHATIEVTSEKDNGTTFIITHPIDEVAKKDI